MRSVSLDSLLILQQPAKPILLPKHVPGRIFSIRMWEHWSGYNSGNIIFGATDGLVITSCVHGGDLQPSYAFNNIIEFFKFLDIVILQFVEYELEHEFQFKFEFEFDKFKLE